MVDYFSGAHISNLIGKCNIQEQEIKFVSHASNFKISFLSIDAFLIECHQLFFRNLKEEM